MHDDDPDTSRPADRAERGLSLVEIIVVMVIIAVLLGIAINAIASSRSAGRSASAIAAAQAYANAVDQYARDHDGRYPRAPGSTDWPGGRDAGIGPVADVLGMQKRHYLRAIPEPVQDGSVQVQRSGPASITYERSGAGYQFVIRVEGRPDCALRGGPATATSPNACSRR